MTGVRQRAVWWRLGLFAGLLVAAVVVAVLVDVPSVTEMRRLVATSGPVGPLVFVLLYAAYTLAPLPKSILSVAGGAVFGFGDGVLLVYVAALLGAAAAFALGRLLGRDAVERLTGTRIARVEEIVRRRGLLALIAARLVPILPFTVLNYSAGLTSLRRRDYALGTAVGIVPGTVAYVALGSSAGNIGSWPFVTAFGTLAVLTVGGVLLARRRRQRE